MVTAAIAKRIEGGEGGAEQQFGIESLGERCRQDRGHGDHHREKHA